MRGEDFTGFLLSICNTVISFYVLQFAPSMPLLAASIATANELLHIHHCTLCVCSSVSALMHSVVSQASESHACPVGSMRLANSSPFHTPRIAPITIILKTAPVWVIHLQLVHIGLLWPRSHGYKGLVYLEMEAYWLHNYGRTLILKYQGLMRGS